MTFQRGSMTLTKALDIVEDRLLDCENTGFNPENDTLAMLYYNLLRDGLETTQYRILNRLEPNAPSEEDDLGPADRVLRIVELIAEDIEGHSDNKQHDATKPVFGGVAEGSKGRRTWNCNRCGDKQCVSLKTKKKDDCPARTSKCEYCKKLGHSETCCWKKHGLPSMMKQNKKSAAAAEQNIDSGSDTFDEDKVAHQACATSSRSHF